MLPPANTPAEPSPLTARPAINTAELPAAAEISDPATNTANEAANTAFMGRHPYSRPKTRTTEQDAKRYAVPYQPTSARAPKRSETTGASVATQLAS